MVFVSMSQTVSHYQRVFFATGSTVGVEFDPFGFGGTLVFSAGKQCEHCGNGLKSLPCRKGQNYGSNPYMDRIFHCSWMIQGYPPILGNLHIYIYIIYIFILYN